MFVLKSIAAIILVALLVLWVGSLGCQPCCYPGVTSKASLKASHDVPDTRTVESGKAEK